jgi:hypothetical protein
MIVLLLILLLILWYSSETVSWFCHNRIFTRMFLIPGVEFESDDSLNEKTFLLFLQALNDGMDRLRNQDLVLKRVRIWRGRMVMVDHTGQGYVFLVSCPKCPFSKVEAEDDV